jgi:hypothetical protein
VFFVSFHFVSLERELSKISSLACLTVLYAYCSFPPYVGIPLIWFIGSMPVCSLTDDQLLAERCSLSLRR